MSEQFSELFPAPTITLPFVREDLTPTLRASEWINLINLVPTLQGDGNPEGVWAAKISQTYIDTSAGSSDPFYYIKQFSDVGGDRKLGWRLIL